MRLLQSDDDGNLSLIEFFESAIPNYAILSHRWEAEEVTFKDIIDGRSKFEASYDKILFCGKQARRDGLKYFWVDTCCIDKSSSAELSEAANSMFRWYRNATKCYVYLQDVSYSRIDSADGSEKAWEWMFRRSAWFSRGWTLQELIAPLSVDFFSKEGKRLGNKVSLERCICEATSIPASVLRGSPLSEFSVAERMSWAAGRETLRQEDMAYSLLGIFDINMPLIYGEGKDKAMKRLREEIDKTSEGFRREDVSDAFSVSNTSAHPWKHSLPQEESGSPYNALCEDQFRLIVLHKADDEQYIRCTLKTVSWSNLPSYTALSYMWGDENNPSTIYLNSYPVKVSRNLDSALRELRRPDCENTLWIDALAIDQSNARERGHQSETSFKNLVEFLHLDRFDGLSTSENIEIGYEQWSQAVSEYVVLCKNPYWRRVWVAQEIAYARNAKVLLHGCPLLDYNLILQGAQTLRKMYWQVAMSFSVASLAFLDSSHRNGPARMGESGSARISTALDRKQKQWLTTICGKSCKDNRDYIYGLLHLFPSSVQETIVIDYKSTTHDVFRSFTKMYIEASEDLSVICWGKGGNSSLPGPSWVGDFSVGAADPFTAFDLHLRNIKMPSPPSSIFKFSDDAKDLSVFGRYIGEISNKLNWHNPSAFDLEVLFRSWDLDPTPAILRTFRRTFLLGQKDLTTADLTELSTAMPPKDILYGGRLMFKLQPANHQTPPTNNKGVKMRTSSFEIRPKDKTFKTLLHNLRTADAMERAMEHAMEHAMEDSIDRTAYLSVGPCGLRLTDKVFAIYGCSPYVVLRPHGDKYRIVGDAYVDSSSDSQLSEILGQHDDEFVEIILS